MDIFIDNGCEFTLLIALKLNDLLCCPFNLFTYIFLLYQRTSVHPFLRMMTLNTLFIIFF